jgi:hypothetical protein
MRRSKNAHVVALLREKLGSGNQPLSQEKFAASVDVKRRTIQDVELGVRPISVSLADKISRRWDVSMACLRQNDLKNGLRHRNGQPWTASPSAGIGSQVKPRPIEKASWDTLSEAALHSRVVSTQVLVSQFQNLRDYFDHGACDKQETILQWQFLFFLCFRALDRLQTDGTYHRRDYSGDDVEATLGDLHALNKTLHSWCKRAKKLELQMDTKAGEAVRNLFGDRYGWDIRGTEAYELALEEGIGNALRMDPAVFASKLNDRLRGKGLRLLYREVTFKECFEALRSVYEENFRQEGATNA